MRLYLTWIIAVAILLMVGSESVRILGALVLVVGAWPVWQAIYEKAMQRSFNDAARFLDALRHDPEDTPPHDSDHPNLH